VRTVWVLDDSEASASELLPSLPPLLYDVTVWTDPLALLGALREDAPDLLIVEHGLAAMPSVDLVSEVKRDDHRVPIIVVARQTSTQGAIESMREGAFDYLPRETLPSGLEDAARRALSGEGSIIQTIGSPGPGDVAELGAMVGRTPEMVEIHKVIGQVAPGDAPVLVHGEQGTGKELVARAIHYNSGRRGKPFVAVSCATLAPEAMEIDLLGSEGGGSRPGVGRLEQADGGTVFVDEVHEATPTVQAGLLSVLERGFFERPGSRSRVKVDVRVIAATSSSLVSLMKAGTFRVDLFYRLKVVSLFIPPLRERRDDIPSLAEHFLRRAVGRVRRDVEGMSPAAVELLQSYAWPGNLRELEQAMLRAAALSRTGVLTPEDFADLVSGEETVRETGDDLDAGVRGAFARLAEGGDGEIDEAVVGRVERLLAEEAMRKTGGNQVRAAKLLGISRNTLRKRLKGEGS